MDSIYEKRPWLKSYPEWVPHNLEITPDTALDDFRASAARLPGSPALYYFDHVISYGEIDQLSDCLAAVLSDLGLEKGDLFAKHEWPPTNTRARWNLSLKSQRR